jgi:sugar phosphate isomerase/epimerase
VTLGTSSVWPDDIADAFEFAAEAGYDGAELMITIDPATRDEPAIRELSRTHGVPVLSVHAPTLLATQTVFGLDPWGKLERSAELAVALGAPLVVVHPPFRWQKGYAEGFAEGIVELEQRHGVSFAVENMYPWKLAGRVVEGYVPSWDPTDSPYRNLVLDVSHAAASGADSLAMAKGFGERLAHIHLTDGSGAPGKDEHLVPGRGSQPAAELLRYVASSGFGGAVCVEVATRRERTHARRHSALVESLEFARTHLSAGQPGFEVDSGGRVSAVGS